MEIIEIIVLAITGGVLSSALYITMGIGAANAEKAARGNRSINMFTVFLWPIALGCWCFDDSI